MALSTTIKSIQDIMRKDVGVDGDAQRIGQLVWLLFLKIWDDRELELELLEDGFVSPLIRVCWTDTAGEIHEAPDLRWRAWAANPEGITGDALLTFVNDTLFPALKGLEPGPRVEHNPAAEALRRRRALVKGIFEDAYQYMKSGILLRQVINKVQEKIDFNDSRKRHLFGDIYEQLLRDLQSAGNAGEYYTPRAVTQFAVDMVDPKLGEVILDPACGTGGFLACAIEHVRRHEVQTPGHELLLQSCIQGVEKKPLPHLLCTTNMIVHGIDVPTGIRHDNTLARPLRDIGMRDRVDVVLTNPPFGGMEEDGIEHNFLADFRTRETADLFLVLLVELLKPGGRAAMVLPDGTLFGEGVKTRIKERLLTECELHTVVRLPKGVFAPYTSIQTNILFFTKGRPTQEVWYYEHPYPLGYKSYSKTKPMRIEDEVPFEVPEGWLWCRVDDCFDVAGGIQKSGKRQPVQNAFPYLRVANVQRGWLDLGKIHEFELFEGELDRWHLKAGDLLVVEGNGSENEIGRCARWNDEIVDCVHQNHLIRCRPLGASIEHFVLRYLNSPAGIETMKALAVTTSGLYNLSVGKIRDIGIPLPPLPEQHRIVTKVDAMLALCDALETHLAAAREAQASFAAAAVHHLDVGEHSRQAMQTGRRGSIAV